MREDIKVIDSGDFLEQDSDGEWRSLGSVYLVASIPDGYKVKRLSMHGPDAAVTNKDGLLYQGSIMRVVLEEETTANYLNAQ